MVNTDLDILVHRIKKLDNRFSFIEEDLEAAEDEDINDILDGAKLDDKAQDIKFRKLLEEQPYEVLKSVAYLSKDTDFKERIAAAVNSKIDKEVARVFIGKNKEAFNAKGKGFLVRAMLDLGANNSNMPKVVKVVAKHNTDTIKKNISISVKKDREHRYTKGLPISQKEILNVEKDMEIKKMVEQLKKNISKGKYKKQITPTSLAKLVNTRFKKANLIKRSLTQIIANKQVTSLYNVPLNVIKIDGKSTRKYIFKDAKRIKLDADFNL